METRNSNRGQPSRGKNLVRFLIGREHGSPTSNSPSFHVGIASREQHGKDVEWYEAGIGDEGEEVVASRAPGWSRLCVANEVVDGVQADDEISTRLRMLAAFKFRRALIVRVSS
jgi:hypothetical protein